MKPSFIFRRTGLLRDRWIRLVASLLLFHLAAAGQQRQIRLRNETISTPPRTDVAGMASGLAAQTAAAGLFLVQFDGAVEPAWQAELRSRGVELLKYVPDDAFITKFNNVSPDKVRALSFVRWVGPYRPDHKIHPRLAAAVRGALQTNQVVAVSALIAPQATPGEIAEVHSLFSTIAHESQLRQGTILRGGLAPNRVNALAQSSSVLWIERAPRHKLVDEAASKLVGGDDGLVATPTVTQQLGLGGAGVTMCVADTGLDSGNTNTMHPDLSGQVTGFKKAQKQG